MSMTKEAAEVSANRGSQYGDFADMARLAQSLKSMVIRKDMNAVERESMEMICTKIARLAIGNPHHRDSWFDIAGYANLVVANLDWQNEPKIAGRDPSMDVVGGKPGVVGGPGNWTPVGSKGY